MSTSDARQRWKEWREERAEAASAPYGPLALTGTHWLSELPEGRIPDTPGRWTEAPDGAGVLLTASAGDGLTLDGRPFEGATVLTADAGPGPARVRHGERKLLVLCREGQWAVRVFDPAAPGRRAFAGIDAFAYDASWVLPGVFRPYDRDRTVAVENADGRTRGLGVAGELAFVKDGEEYALRVSAEADGSLWAVIADGTSGVSSYRFRFLKPGVPDAEGRLTVDFNRALLPPCAFAEHFICPFPPPGNRLPFDVPAGERNLLAR